MSTAATTCAVCLLLFCFSYYIILLKLFYFCILTLCNYDLSCVNNMALCLMPYLFKIKFI